MAREHGHPLTDVSEIRSAAQEGASLSFNGQIVPATLLYHTSLWLLVDQIKRGTICRYSSEVA